MGGDTKGHAYSGAEFILVIWDDALTEILKANLSTPVFGSIVVIMHRTHQVLPTYIKRQPLVRMCFEDEPRDAVPTWWLRC